MSEELDPDWGVIDDPTPKIDRKPLLLILGGMAILAVTLGVLQARMKQKQNAGVTLQDLPLDADWRVSLQHVVDKFNFQMSGHEQRLSDLQNSIAELRMMLAQPAQPQPPDGEVPGMTHPVAAVSLPSPVPDNNGEAPPLMVERVPPQIDTGPVHDAPAVASVSLPPE